MKSGWLCVGADCPGRMQMNLDRRMLTATQNDGRTRVRLYRFKPPAVSLGHNQKRGEIDSEACSQRGFDIVRRPTGGRAVLHKGDLVYSITVATEGVNEETPLQRGVYNLVSLALIRGIRALGIDAGGTEDTRLRDARNPDLPRLCFSSATRYEVQIGGRKLVGSAQRRGQGAVLQHGSILVTDEHLELTDLLSGGSTERSRALESVLRKRTISLHEAGYERSLKEIIESLTASFSEVFDPIERVDAAEFEECLSKEFPVFN